MSTPSDWFEPVEEVAPSKAVEASPTKSKSLKDKLKEKKEKAAEASAPAAQPEAEKAQEQTIAEADLPDSGVETDQMSATSKATLDDYWGDQ